MPSPQKAARKIVEELKFSGSRPIQFTHIGQLHWVPEAELMPGMVEKVFLSQWKIIELIRSRSPKIILTEGEDESSFSSGLAEALANYARVFREDLERIDQPKIRAAIQFFREFQNGIPLTADTLTANQRMIMARLGGVFSLWLSGEIVAVQGAENASLSAEANSHRAKTTSLLMASSGTSSKAPSVRLRLMLRYAKLKLSEINRKRESFALRRVSEFIQTSEQPHPHVFLIFGAAHNFSAYSGPDFKIEFVNTEPD